MHDYDAIVEGYIRAIEQRDADAFGAYFSEDAVARHPLFPEPVRGRAAIRAGEQAIFDAFSDIDIDVAARLADGSRCALEVVITAVNTGPLDLGGEGPLPATGRRIEMPASWWMDLGDDGLIVSERDYFDTATLMTQLGLADEG